MKANIYFILGYLFALGLCFLVMLSRKSKWEKAGGKLLDERQLQVRATAAKLGFFTMVAANITYGMICTMVEKSIFQPLVATFICVMIGMIPFLVYSIVKDAYFSLNESPVRIIVIQLAVAFSSTMQVLDAFQKDAIYTSKGQIGMVAFHLVFIAMIAIVMVTLILHHLKLKKEEE